MRTLKLRWFTNPETLAPVGRFLLATFINRFRDDLAMPGIYPPSPESQTPHYFFQVGFFVAFVSSCRILSSTVHCGNPR